MDGDVTVRVTHSTVNYKDGLALSGKSADPAQISDVARHRLRRHRRELRAIPDFKPGDEVRRQRLRPRRNPFRRLLPKRRGSRATGWSNCRRRSAAPRRWRSAPPATPRRSRSMRWRRRASRRDRAGGGDGRGGRRRLGRHRAARQGRLERHRLDRPRAGSRLSQSARRGGNHRPRDPVRARQSRSPRSAGSPASTASARTRSPTCCRRRATAAPSPPAASRAAWTCRAPSRRSSCAACGCSASTACNARCRRACAAWARLARDLDRGPARGHDPTPCRSTACSRSARRS